MTTIVFVVLANNEVKGVFEDDALATFTASGYEEAIVDAWVLDSRSAEEATLADYLDSRRVNPMPKSGLKKGDEVYFCDDTVRGIGTIETIPDDGSYYRIFVKSGALFDRVSRGIVRGDTPVFMYYEDIKGVLEAAK